MVKAVRPQKLWKWLITMKKILDGMQIPFFLSVGTCLWLYRDGDWLDDDDVDIGIMEEYEHKFDAIITIAKSRGWVVKTFIDEISGKGKMISISSGKQKDGYVDIAFHYRFKDKVWKSLNNGYCIPEVFDAKLFENFATITIKGIDFLIPNPTEDYLEEIYGSEWRTPNGGIIQYKENWYLDSRRRCMIYNYEKAKAFLERVRDG